MFTVHVESVFHASHQLTFADGSRESSHRHDWRVIAGVDSYELNGDGLVMDFHQLKELLDGVVAEFENKSLNEIDYFKRNSSSAENAARYIYEKLENKLPKGVRLRNVKVFEQPGFSAKFAK